MIVISTITNGPYWKSSFEPILYPTGISFYRPFSYREQWIDPSLRTEFTDPKFKLKKWLNQNNKAIFCIRFLGEHVSKLVPIRQVILDHLNVGTATHVYFRLGPFVDYSQLKFPTIIDAKVAGIADEALFFRAEDSLFQFGFAGDSVWTEIANRLTDPEPTLPFNEGHKVFLMRMSAAFAANKQMKPRQLLRSPIKGPIFGYRLSRREVSEIRYEHLLRSHVAGSNGKTAEIKYQVSTDNVAVEIQDKRISVQGSAREHAVTLSALVESPSTFNIVCSPENPTADPVLPVVSASFKVGKRWYWRWADVALVVFFFGAAYYLIRTVLVTPELKPVTTPMSLFVGLVIIPTILKVIENHVRG